MRTLMLIILAIVLGGRIAIADAIWSSYVKNNRYDFHIEENEIGKMPVWKESDEHPPLSARKAIRAGKARLAELISESKEWKLERLSLVELRNGHWVYLAIFEAPTPPGRWEGRPFMMTIPITMNGVAVKPKVSPWPEK